MIKFFLLFKIRRCEQCGRKYLQLFGINQWCSEDCRFKAYNEFEEDMDMRF